MHTALRLLSATLVLVFSSACGSPVDDRGIEDTRAGDPSSHTMGMPEDATRTHPQVVSLLDFAPTVGVGNTPLTLFADSDLSGCFTDGLCSVSIGGQDVALFDDEGGLTVLVPRTASSGDVCLRFHETTTCQPGFTALDTVQVASADVTSTADGVTLTIFGEGFPVDPEVHLGGTVLESFFVSTDEIVATVPTTVSAGAHDLRVRAPGHRRCGGMSAPLSVVVP